MKKIYLITILLLYIPKIFSQNKNLVITQKFYHDTLLTDYRKVKFVINLETDVVTRINYFTVHTADTTNAGEVKTQKFGLNENEKKEVIGDTVFNKYERLLAADTIVTLTKRVYEKYGIIYAARIFPKAGLIPYNELKYQYDKTGNLIQIVESYNDNSGNIVNYRTIFTYKYGIVTRMKEYKQEVNNWTTEKVWDYIFTGNYNIKQKVKRKINSLLIDGQFKNLPW